ncbi:hypothetical protein FRC04_007937 [Tulasnella sp. 424]|nr:hypothetical protein FRC04_007937 [Tulasnella sp. 424]
MSFAGHAYTVVTSEGGQAITLASDGAGVVTPFAGSVYTVATADVASAATNFATYVTSIGGHAYTVITDGAGDAFTLATGAAGDVTSIGGSFYTRCHWVNSGWNCERWVYQLSRFHPPGTRSSRVSLRWPEVSWLVLTSLYKPLEDDILVCL